jgi:hypothetical protein
MESKSSGISKVAEHEWLKNESLGEVTGLPTRDHWKVSSDSVFLPIPYIPVAAPNGAWRMGNVVCELVIFLDGVLTFWQMRNPEALWLTPSSPGGLGLTQL